MTPSEVVQDLRTFALKYPETQEGVACLGTPLEKRTLQARSKAFLFLGRSDVMLKLRDSLPDAIALAAAEPERCKVGAHGWVTVTLEDTDPAALDRLKAWIDESFRVLANKRLVAMLP